MQVVYWKTLASSFQNFVLQNVSQHYFEIKFWVKRASLINQYIPINDHIHGVRGNIQKTEILKIEKKCK